MMTQEQQELIQAGADGELDAAGQLELDQLLEVSTEARALFEDDEFVEIYLDVPLDVAESRDPKGLYRKARAGELPHFTGIDSPYEAPETADIHVPTAELSLDECVERVLKHV